MAKSIKKSIKYFIIGIGIIVMFPTLMALFLQLPLVQTLVVRRITGHLSETVSSTISVGKFEYKFFNRLQLNDILIKDRNQDTLAYIKRLTAGIRSINFDDRSFTIGKLEIENPVLGLITDSTGEMNLTWYLNMLKTQSDTVKKASSTIKINQIAINNGRISIINKQKSKKNAPLDYSNLNLVDVNMLAGNIISGNDSTSFNIYDLNFREKGGFLVRKLSTSAYISSTDYILKSLSISCDSSIINFDHIALRADSAGSFKNFINEVRLNILLDKSLVSFSDLKYFIPGLREMNQSFQASGKILGTVSELRGRNIDLSFGNYTQLSCDFDLSGLPKIENSYIYLGVNSLKTKASDIARIIIPGKGPIVLPDVISKLGMMEFDGSFTGFTTDFVTYGNFHTSAGTIRTDISLRPEESKQFRVKGLISLRDIALGYLTDNTKLLGNITMKADVDGFATSLRKFNGSLAGKIDSVELNSYMYRNVALKGNFSEKAWDGSVTINEDNIRMDILGLFNFQNKLPEFDFTLNLAKANLYKLNFDRADTSSRLSMLLTANFRGSNIDNLDGEIRLLNSTLRKYENNLDLYDFSIRTFSENNKPAINIRTDFVDADLRGYYNFAGLGNVFSTTMSVLMPSKYQAPARKNFPIKNNFIFSVNFKKTDKLFNFFRTGILLADKSTIHGSIFPDSIMNIKADTRMLNVKNIVARDLSFEASIKNPILTAKLTTSSLNILNQTQLGGFCMGFSVHPDTLNLALNWDNHDKVLNIGSISARGIFTKSLLPGGKGLLNIFIDSTDIYSEGNLWKISRSSINIDTSTLRINRMFLTNNANFYHINGAISRDPADTLSLEVKGIDISPLNTVTDKNASSDEVRLAIRGNLNGKILLTNVYKQPLIVSNLTVKNFSILGGEYGNVDISTAWNNDRKVADIHARNDLDGKNLMDIEGYYDPVRKYLFLDGVTDKMPVDAMNPLLKAFASGINGTASGKVNLSGAPGRLVLKGALMVENANIKIDFLQTKYKMNDSVRFERNKIVFRKVKVTDEKGNTATLNGSINHKYFKDFTADMMINTNNCMVLNTKPKDNSLFYGSAFASGVTTIKSDPGAISFDISAKTGKNTKFFIPMNSSSTVSDYSFVDFISHDSLQKKDEEIKSTLPVAQTVMDLNFDLEVTPDAEIQIIFDPKVGDIMKGTGSGNLAISVDKQGNFKIYGDYIIENGEYLFTLKNILNKSFSVESGGKIIFNGDIYNAGIDIKAIYKTKASLYEITGDDRYKEQIPVQCQISLSGKLFNPVVGLDIYLPTADESTRTYLKNMITTEEELSRQFLYLLVTGHFYSDLFAGSSVYSSTTATGTSAMAVTTAEMVSTQLSNMLSKISNDFNVGFVYRPGYKDLNSNEVRVALSTQLLNDRVMINGNFDVTGANSSSSTNNQLIGDFDIETKITDKIKFKVFNRYNDPYTGKTTPYTQGIGIFYKEDFDKLADIFRKKVSSGTKKANQPKPVNTKSITPGK
jgi:hypothetical protein